MARYANHECAGCGLILPAYELSRVEDTVETGTSRTERRIGTSLGFRHSATTKHFAKRSKLLCGKCRLTRVLSKLIMAAIVGTVLFALVISGDGKRTNNVLPSPADTSDAGSPPEVAADPVADELPATEGDANPVGDGAADRQADRATDVASHPPSASPPVPVPSAADQIATAPEAVEPVQRAMQAAVESGKPKRWKANKLHGYAVPSEPGADGCRMVQVTIDEGGAQSAARKLCPSAAGA